MINHIDFLKTLYDPSMREILDLRSNWAILFPHIDYISHLEPQMLYGQALTIKITPYVLLKAMEIKVPIINKVNMYFGHVIIQKIIYVTRY